MQDTIEGFRLSPQQERLWSLQQQGHAYWACCSLLLIGPLDTDHLYQALFHIFTRHETFRTRFCRLPGMALPLQVIDDLPQFSWSSYDLQQVDPAEQQRVIAELTQVPPELTLDYEHGPLLHCTLFTLAPQQQLFSLHLPSLLADRRTLLNLSAELAQAYASLSEGLPIASDPEEVVQYLQFSEWQHSLLEDEHALPLPDHDASPFSPFTQSHLPFCTHLEHTTTKTGASPTPSPLAHYRLPVDPSLYTHMQSFLEHHHTSLPVFLLSCWTSLLARLGRYIALPLGIEVDGRIYDDLALVAGQMTRTLPFQCPLDLALPFCELIEQVQQRYDLLLRESAAFPSPFHDTPPDTHSPLLPFGFACDLLSCNSQAGPLRLHLQTCLCDREPFLLHLLAQHQTDHLLLFWQYQADLFPQTTIARLAEQFLTMLAAALHAPHTSLARLPLLSQAQRQHLLVNLNPPSPTLPPPLDLFGMIAEVARRSPDAIAIEYADQQLSYQNLLQQAHRLAQVLRSHQVGPEQLVGVYLPRDPSMLISLLAILQTGAAYVPIDPQAPPQRLHAILQHAHIRLCLCSTDLATNLSSDTETIVLIVEPLLLDTTPQAETNDLSISAREVLPERLAYVMFTSGSTGQPKGVMISQRALASYVSWASHHYRVAKGAGAPVHSSLAFDLTVTSLYTPLVVGRRVVLVPASPGIEGLSQVLSEQGSHSLLKITPAHLELLSQHVPTSRLAQVADALIIGGEALSGTSLQTWQRFAPSTRLINEYGPTETVVGCCIYEVPVGTMTTGNIPIGRPIPHVQLYVLDEHLEPVPLGMSGELYIGGRGVARGYFGQPDLTAERFVPHPFATTAGKRLYKTGDLVRSRDEQGTFEFLGRVDRQVKLRGYRIELEEIESVLGQHPSVRDCAVLLREDALLGPQLTGYLVLHDQQTPPDKEELRTFIQTYLPTYTVPSVFFVLPSMPLTLNGKIDLRRLLNSEDAREVGKANDTQEAATTIIPPRDVNELHLLHIWEEVLQQPNISIFDNFFDLGGHSILAVRVLAHIQKQFQQDLTLATFLLNPTIAEQAIVLRQKNSSKKRSLVVGLQTKGSRPPLFCIHPSGGTVMNYIYLSHHIGKDQPLYGLQSMDVSEDTSTTIEELATHYINAIRTVQPEGPYLLSGWSMGGIIAYEMAQQLREHGEQVAMLALIDSRVAANTEEATSAPTANITLSDEAFARMMAATFKIELPPDFEQLDRARVIDHIFSQAKQMYSLPIDAQMEQVRQVFTAVKKHNQMARQYKPQSYPCWLDYFVAQDTLNQSQEDDKNDDQDTEITIQHDILSVWKDLVEGELNIHTVPGNHRLMVEEPNVQILAEMLRSCIDRVLQYYPQ